VEAAMIVSLGELARALGGEVAGNQVLAPGPGHGPKDRSLSVRLSATAPDGFVAFSHCGDDWQVCRDYVRQRLSLPHDAWKDAQLARPHPTKRHRNDSEEAERARKIADAISLWAVGVDPRGTLAEIYLASRRLELGDDLAGRVIRWHPGISAALALFRDIRNDEPRAISRTFLDAHGRKLERKFLGPVGGSAIKLDPDEDVLGGLHIGEGAESCLAARQLGCRPCWALGSKGAIGVFPVLSHIETLTILAEPDAEREVEACASRWHLAGREVLITRTVGGGKDANDVLMRMQA
jgi:hypothetical protein